MFSSFVTHMKAPFVRVIAAVKAFFAKLRSYVTAKV